MRFFFDCLITIALTLSVIMFSDIAYGHGTMSEPCVRGLTSGETDFSKYKPFPDDKTDWKIHFPAGDKGDTPGAGKRSQEKAAGSAGWTLFEPLRPDFKWRSGVCGDTLTGNAHLRGGEYYNGGKIVRTYQQGGTFSVGLSINAHHNGFIQLHLCDVSKCNGEISRDCFRQGHCKELERAYVKECEDGYSRWCPPIDPAYPGRFYLPCSRFPFEGNLIDYFGFNPEVIRYKLPKNWHGPHFVLQWFWTTGNGCNPKGVREYFTGPHAPKNWGNCAGDGEAKGGWSSVQRDCDSNRFPEEYLQCADIAINPKDGRTNYGNNNQNGNRNNNGGNNGNQSSDKPKKKPNGSNVGGNKGSSYDVDKARKQGSGGVRDIVLVGDGRRIRSLVYNSNVASVGKYSKITIEAITEVGVTGVKFYLGGRLYNTVTGNGPFYISGKVPGSKQPKEWKDWAYNRQINIVASARGDNDAVSVKFVK